MITRKIDRGDILMLAEGNAFWCNDVVRCRAGYAVDAYDSEEGDPLVEICGGYTVKRSDLSELNPQQGRIATIIMQSSIPEALNGIDRQERKAMAEELEGLLA